MVPPLRLPGDGPRDCGAAARARAVRVAADAAADHGPALPLRRVRAGVAARHEQGRRWSWSGGKRTWRCAEPMCAAEVFTEQHDALARPRALLTARACRWAINQLRREHASVQGLARQLGTAWCTVWRSIPPLLEALAGDESRFDGVTTLGVDEHVWHHTSTRPEHQGGRGPKELGVAGVGLASLK